MLLRLTVLAVVALSSSGCLQYVLVMGNSTQKAEAYRSVIDGAVGDAAKQKDCPRWIAGLNSIREKLPVKGSRGDRTYYASEIEDAYHECTYQAVVALKQEGDEREKLALAVERFERVLSLPLAELEIKDRELLSGDTLPGKVKLAELKTAGAARLVELNRLAAEKRARQDKRIEAAKAAEAKGWPVAALAAWNAVEPMDAAMKTLRDEALTRVGPQARAVLAVPVALASTQLPEAVLAQVRTSSLLAERPTLKLVDSKDAATVQVELGAGPAARETAKETLQLEHVYVSSTKEVPNPQIERLRGDLARFEKEAEWNRKGAESACKNQRSGPCKLREMRLRDMRDYQEKAMKARQHLAKEKPTVRRDVTSTFPYTAEKTILTASAPLTVTMTSRLAPSPSKVSGTAKIQRTAVDAAGNEKVGLAPRHEAHATPAELEAALSSECVRLFVETAATAPAIAAGEFDAKAAAATEPLEKLQHALVRALRSGQSADVEAAAAISKTVIETGVETKTLLSAMR